MNLYIYELLDGSGGGSLRANTEQEAYIEAREDRCGKDVKIVRTISEEEEDQQDHISSDKKCETAEEIRSGNLTGLQGGSLNNFTLGSYLHCMDGVRANEISKNGFSLGRKGEVAICDVFLDGDYARIRIGPFDVMYDDIVDGGIECNQFNFKTNLAKAFIFTDHNRDQKRIVACSYPCFGKLNFKDFFTFACTFIDEYLANKEIFTE